MTADADLMRPSSAIVVPAAARTSNRAFRSEWRHAHEWAAPSTPDAAIRSDG